MTLTFTLKTTAAIAFAIGVATFCGHNVAAQTTQTASPLLTPTNVAPTPLMSLTAPRTEFKMGIARLDTGRVIGASFEELRGWAALSQRTGAKFAPISPTAINHVTAAYNAGGSESTNKLDEIRMIASDKGQPYVLVYGMGRDAEWGAIGGLTLRDHGLNVPYAHKMSPKAKIKALIIETHSGRVVGTALSNTDTDGLLDLTRRVETLINNLPDTPTSAVIS